MAGERRRSRNTPALTIVLEWSRAEVGDGAYIAPINQELKGIWALLVMPANASSATAARSVPETGPAVSFARSRPFGWFDRSAIASPNPRPPRRFMLRALKA